MRLPWKSDFWLLSGNLGEMQQCCQYRPAKLIISSVLWMAFFGRASGPPAKSLICRPFATAHRCHPSKQVLRFWNNLAANPGHLIGGLFRRAACRKAANQRPPEQALTHFVGQ
jgi:hypothetical protein